MDGVASKLGACLYCDRKAASEEHPLPFALGEFVNAPLLKERICAECNTNRIGKLDEQFTRCGPEAVYRTQLGITGRKHHNPVSVFYRRSAGGGRIEAKSWDSNFGCFVNLEFLGGNEARQLTEMILLDETGKDYHVPLTSQMTPEYLRQQVAALGLKSLAEARFTCDNPEEGWVHALIKSTWPAAEFSDTVAGARSFEGGLFRFELTDRYFRAVAKIGFHYFLTQFQMFSGQEDAFTDIRMFIINDTNAPPTPNVNRFVKLRSRSVLFPPYRKGLGIGHVLVAEIRDGLCLAHFEPFTHENGGLEARTIVLGRVGDECSAKHAHLHLYYPDRVKRGRFVGEAYPLGTEVLNIESGDTVDVLMPQGDGSWR